MLFAVVASVSCKTRRLSLELMYRLANIFISQLFGRMAGYVERAGKSNAAFCRRLDASASICPPLLIEDNRMTNKSCVVSSRHSSTPSVSTRLDGSISSHTAAGSGLRLSSSTSSSPRLPTRLLRSLPLVRSLFLRGVYWYLAHANGCQLVFEPQEMADRATQAVEKVMHHEDMPEDKNGTYVSGVETAANRA